MNIENLYIWIVIIILFIITIIHIVSHDYNQIYENFTNSGININNESLQNISSLYNNNKLIMDNILVKGNLEVNGATTFENKMMIGDNIELDGSSDTDDRMRIYTNPEKTKYMTMGKNLILGKKEGDKVLPWEIDDELVVDKLTVKNGSNFSGGRHYFTTNAGTLRVGGAWRIPGIYAENGKGLGLQYGNGKYQFNDENHVFFIMSKIISAGNCKRKPGAGFFGFFGQ